MASKVSKVIVLLALLLMLVTTTITATNGEILSPTDTEGIIPIETKTDGISGVEVEVLKTGTVIVTVTDINPLLSKSMEAKVIFADYREGCPTSYTIRLGNFFSSSFGKGEEREFSFRFPAKDRIISGITIDRA